MVARMKCVRSFSWMTSVLVLLAGASLALAAGKPGYPTQITWSGRTWQLKSSQSKVGPGPNYFSASPENVWVDASGRLHLRLTFRNGRWNCPELIGTQTLGYGTYVFEIASPVANLDPNVVLGLFTWSDKAPAAHREIDVEFARWGNAGDPTNAQYVVQPYDLAGHLHRLSQPAAAAPTVHGFTWRRGRIDFASSDLVGWDHDWSYVGSDVPPSRDERVRLNLWLFGGAAPTNGQEVEVVVTRFTFTP
jgi:hypothetical protein